MKTILCARTDYVEPPIASNLPPVAVWPQVVLRAELSSCQCPTSNVNPRSKRKSGIHVKAETWTQRLSLVWFLITPSVDCFCEVLIGPMQTNFQIQIGPQKWGPDLNPEMGSRFKLSNVVQIWAQKWSPDLGSEMGSSFGPRNGVQIWAQGP